MDLFLIELLVFGVAVIGFCVWQIMDAQPDKEDADGRPQKTTAKDD